MMRVVRDCDLRSALQLRIGIAGAPVFWYRDGHFSYVAWTY